MEYNGEALRNNMVTKLNPAIQETRFSLTAQKFDLLTCLIGKIKRSDSPDTVYEISVKEFCEATGKKYIDGESGYYYTTIKADLLEIANKGTYMLMDDGREHIFRWLEDVICEKGSGTIQVVFHPRARPYLFELTKNFTSYPVEHILALETMAAKRLYEILYSYKALGRRMIEINALKRELNAQGYDRIYDFRKYILDKAIDEINKYTDIEVSYKTKNAPKSKKIVGIDFTINDVEYGLASDLRKTNRKIAFKYNHDEKLWEQDCFNKTAPEAASAPQSDFSDEPQ